jgi:RHS repeat-associated protein
MVEVRQGGSPNELLQQAHYYPFGMEIEGQWAYVQPQVGQVNAYLYNGKELNADFGLGWSDYGARWYDGSIGRWNGVDALAEEYGALSPYNYVANNPLKFVDPDGMRVESTHIDENGSVVAIYDDGDYGIYQHSMPGLDLSIEQKGSYVGSMRAKTGTTSGGGVKIGNSLTPFSFADFGALNEGIVIPAEGAFIDIGNTWANDKVSWLINDWVNNQNSSTLTYARKARRKQPYDLKYQTEKQYGTSAYGSILFNYSSTENIVYASSRDAGNFAAGLVKVKSYFPEHLITLSYGGYNQTQNFAEGVFGGFWNYVNVTGLGNSLRPPYYGEDKGTFLAIEAGAKYEHSVGWKPNYKKSKSGSGGVGMGNHAGRSLSRYRR